MSEDQQDGDSPRNDGPGMSDESFAKMMRDRHAREQRTRETVKRLGLDHEDQIDSMFQTLEYQATRAIRPSNMDGFERMESFVKRFDAEGRVLHGDLQWTANAFRQILEDPSCCLQALGLKSTRDGNSADPAIARRNRRIAAYLYLQKAQHKVKYKVSIAAVADTLGLAETTVKKLWQEHRKETIRLYGVWKYRQTQRAEPRRRARMAPDVEFVDELFSVTLKTLHSTE